MRLPETVRDILNKLETAGFQAYAVGGCVRDSILGKEPDDWDLTTDARPEEVKALFPRTVDTGLQHGTVTVLLGGEGYEVTTYRIDGSYSDGRHPDSIRFTPSLAEDLKRRDFTINAMAVSERGELVDLFGGQEDLARGCIRCVGDPYARFREDALRMLRAVRFAAQLNFEIEAETFKALTELSPNLARVSKERILAELTKLLLSNHPEKLELLYVAGLAPEMAAHFPGVHLDSRAARLPRCKALRFAAAGERITPEALGKLLTELKSDRATRDRAVLLLTAVHKPLPESETEVRHCLSDIGHDAFTELLLLKEAGYGSEETPGALNRGQSGLQSFARCGRKLRSGGTAWKFAASRSAERSFSRSAFRRDRRSARVSARCSIQCSKIRRETKRHISPPMRQRGWKRRKKRTGER